MADTSPLRRPNFPDPPARLVARAHSMPARRASFKLGAATVAENDAKVAQYLRDAQWFARSFSTAADAKVPDKAETKVHVNKLLRGPSTRLTREIVDDDDATSPAAAGGGTLLPTKSTARLGAADAKSKDAQIAELVAALAASEKRHADVLERMDSMQSQLSQLTAVVRRMANGAPGSPGEGPNLGNMFGLLSPGTPRSK